MKVKSLLTALASAVVISLGSVATTQAAILADIIWVIDTSGSMGDDINQVKQRIVDFNTAMTGNNIDAQYGLVRFGGTASLIQDITSFATFNAAGSPFQLLTDNGGGTEDGSAAIQVALGASFRPDTVRNIILITDEDDDNSSNRTNLNTALAGTSANELINVIGNPNDDSNNYYRDLAPANGGLFFNILDFRDNPAAFFTNFINTKVKEIINEGGGGNNNVPEPASLMLMGVGIAGLSMMRRRKKTS
jgi:hypothetical protein